MPVSPSDAQAKVQDLTPALAGQLNSGRQGSLVDAMLDCSAAPRLKRGRPRKGSTGGAIVAGKDQDLQPQKRGRGRNHQQYPAECPVKRRRYSDGSIRVAMPGVSTPTMDDPPAMARGTGGISSEIPAAMLSVEEENLETSWHCQRASLAGRVMTGHLLRTRPSDGASRGAEPTWPTTEALSDASASVSLRRARAKRSRLACRQVSGAVKTAPKLRGLLGALRRQPRSQLRDDSDDPEWMPERHVSSRAEPEPLYSQSISTVLPLPASEQRTRLLTSGINSQQADASMPSGCVAADSVARHSRQGRHSLGTARKRVAQSSLLLPVSPALKGPGEEGVDLPPSATEVPALGRAHRSPVLQMVLPMLPPVWEPAMRLPPPELTPQLADRFAGAKSLYRLTPAEQAVARAECYWLHPPHMEKHPQPSDKYNVRLVPII